MSQAASHAVPIAVMASGRGSNFESIVRAIRDGALNAEVRVVVCDRPGALVLQRAGELGIQSVVVPWPRTAEARSLHDEALVAAIRPFAPHFLVMAGYMRIVTPRLLEEFRSARGYSRVVNIHPSLLPAFPGLDAYAQAFRHGTKVTGATVHLVEQAVDSGPICAQESFSIAECQSAEEVEQRGLAVEHGLYPRTLQWVLPEKFEVDERERRLCVRQS